jgi:hypothetical protein
VVDDQEHAAFVAELAEEVARHAGTLAPLDPLDASDLAWELETFLAERGVAEAGELAPALVGGGWDRAHLERIETEFPGDALGRIVTWVAAGSTVHALVDEVATGAGRISEIVKAVKEYSFMDQAPVQRVDVRSGLDNTLVILRPKLKAGVTVVRDYKPDLPEIGRSGASSTRSGRTSWTTRSTPWTARARSGSGRSPVTRTSSWRSATTGRACRRRFVSGSSSPSTRPNRRAAGPAWASTSRTT